MGEAAKQKEVTVRLGKNRKCLKHSEWVKSIIDCERKTWRRQPGDCLRIVLNTRLRSWAFTSHHVASHYHGLVRRLCPDKC